MGLESAGVLLSNLGGHHELNRVKVLVQLSSNKIGQLLEQIDQETETGNQNQDFPLSKERPNLSVDPIATGQIPRSVVLIDDCPLIRQSWRIFLERRGVNLHSFASAQEFDLVCENFDRSTPLYIDLELGRGVSGLDVSRTYFERGFETIYLATGHERTEARPFYIHGVVGKTPPGL